MKITPRTLELAVLDRLAQFGIYVGGRLSLQDMEEAWAQTGLRRGDLVDGLSQLINIGALRLVSDSSGMYLQLTARGAERQHTARRGLRDVWEESRSLSVLKRAQLRCREPLPGQGRRTLDLPAV